ncbi:hypothetical protein [Acetobacter nitrogenifigens]|uniref:hypothetical protein n=1 Tax=Acetobacter nitrogenifigens TaxID=285268 RepID=UPI00040D96AC|nr:hypothetical protein [Acetobacter nitrogenifigens]
MDGNPSSSAGPTARLSGSRLYRCLMVLGWSERLAAERCHVHRTQLRRAIDGTSSLPLDISAWLLDLESAHLDRPCPRLRTADPIVAGQAGEQSR